MISESPAAGTPESPGSAVNLTVSLGSSVALGTGVGWMPFIATSTGSGGETGLFVLPATAPLGVSASSVSWAIQGTPVVPLGTAFTLQSGNAGNGYWPFLGIYAALDSSNVVQLYAVNLSNASSSAPGAGPVGKFGALGLSALAQICATHSLTQTNLLDPTSWFILMEVAGPSGCGGTVSHVVVTETATTPVSVATASYDVLYSPNGILTGMVMQDASGNLDLYANQGFTNPTVLFGKATSSTTLFARSALATAGFASIGTVEYRLLGSASAATALYRLDYTGAFAAVPSYAPGTDFVSSSLNVTDEVNVYFTDTGAATETLYQIPLGTGGSAPVAPLALYSAPAASAFTAVGSNTSVVVLRSKPTGSPPTTTLSTVPMGVTSSTATTIGSFSGGVLAQLIGDSFYNTTRGALYVDVACPTCTPPTEPYSTEVLDPSGTVLAPLTSDSVFLAFESPKGGYILQVRGITDQNGSTQGGGTLYDVPIGDNASNYTGYAYQTCTQFTGSSCTTTGTFQLQPDTALSLLGILGVSTNYGEGLLESLVNGTLTPTAAVVANVNQQQIGVVTLANTTVALGFR